MTTAVTGATGTIGSELVRLLSARGNTVRALSRNPAGRPSLAGVEWVEADLADRDGLPDVLDGADRLFLLTGNTDDMVRLEKNALRAAAAAGVSRVVKLSALGATDHSRSVIGLWHFNIERALLDSGLSWTILRPHSFMQNLFDPLVFDRQQGVVYSAAGDGAIPFIDTRDIAAVAAVVLTEGGHDGQTYTLTGPEAITHGTVAEILSSVLGRPATYRAQSFDEAWLRRRAADQPPWHIAAQLALAEYQRAGGPTEHTTDTVERLTDRPARSFETFARDHAAALEVSV